ncbi:MAG TPA: IS256 family transposase [archaeon]|nr:IS256 family transposase [archaeon]
MSRTKNKISNPEELELETLVDSKLSTRELISKFIEMVMERERQGYLKKHEQDKGNGFYERDLAILGGPAEISVPRSRTTGFRPAVLPAPYKRMPKEMEDLILQCLASGINKSKVAASMNAMGLPVSEDIIEAFEKTHLEFFRQINTKQLLENMYMVVADCKQVETINKDGNIDMCTIYIAIGIDAGFNRHILGCMPIFERENKDGWTRFFSSLVNRGLKRVMMFITDDFGGITDITSTLFNNSDHQLCIVHLLRNTKKYLSEKDRQIFMDAIDTIKRADDFDAACSMFEELCKKFEEKAPDFVANLRKKKKHFTAFTKYPKQIRKHIYSSNWIEGFNNGIEVKRKDIGGYFRSIEHFQINFAVITKNLLAKKWKKIHWKFQSFQYELCQTFAAKFGVRP